MNSLSVLKYLWNRCKERYENQFPIFLNDISTFLFLSKKFVREREKNKFSFFESVHTSTRKHGNGLKKKHRNSVRLKY